MIERTVTIVNRAGIHARPAAMLVQLTKDFLCNIYIEKGQDRINAKSIMGIITLGASYQTNLKIIAEGEGEEEAVNAIVHLFESKFQEE